ncbi:VOC family protein [Bosea sp. NPDC055353]
MSSASTPKPEPMIIISLRYADAPRMYDWLIEAFGFEKHAAYYSEDGRTLLHGELRMGSSFVMLGSSEGNEFGKLVSRPVELGGTTASPYIATDDIDARCERARKAGAQICMEPTDQPYGSRDFICKDPEGHVWCFGTYRPSQPAT